MALQAYNERQDNGPIRLITGGCLLMSLPVAVLASLMVVLALPLLFSLLPRGYQPIFAAQPDENLLVVAAMAGPGAADPSTALDSQLVEEVDDMNAYSYNDQRQVGRVRSPVTSEAEARALGERNNARMVIWGSYDQAVTSISYTIVRPINLAEPQHYSFDVPGGPLSEEVVAFSAAVFEMGNPYADYNLAANYLYTLPDDLSGTGLAPEVVAFYRAELERTYNANFTLAHEIIDAGLEANPDYAPLHLLDAMIYFYNEAEFESALEALEAGLEAEPDNLSAYLMRGDLFSYMGRYEEALIDYTWVLGKDDDNTLALQGRVTALMATDSYEEALRDVTRLLELQPNDHTLHLLRAEIYLALDRAENALAEFGAALDAASFADWPDDARTSVLQARAEYFTSIEDYQAALADYEQILQVFPYDTRYLLQVGIIYWEMDQPETARTTWESNLDSFASGNPAAANNNLAWELSLEGYNEPALPYIERSLELEPDDPNALHTLGYVYLGLGRYEEAIVAFDESVTQGLGYDPVYRDFGDAYLGAGAYQEAVANYQYYLDLVPYAEDRQRVEDSLAEARAALADEADR